jgi:hypothetical protein
MSYVVGKALRDLARALDALGVDWYLFGAQAAIVYGSTRVTEDIDVTLRLGDRSPRALLAALDEAGFGVRVDDAEAFAERTRVLPFVHRETSMPVDIVLAAPGIEDLFFSRAREHTRDGLAIPVASPEDLVVMKVLASRPHDHEDVRAMVRALGTKLDAACIEETLTLLEQALDQSDLLPTFERLRREGQSLSARMPPSTKPAPKTARKPRKARR